MKKSTLYSWLSAACFGLVGIPVAAYLAWKDWHAFVFAVGVTMAFILAACLIALGVIFAGQSAKARENGQ